IIDGSLVIWNSGATWPLLAIVVPGGVYPGRNQLKTLGAWPGLSPMRLALEETLPKGHRLVGDATLNARAHWTSRVTGSRSLPKVELVTWVSSRASLSVRIARITDFISPRTPLPLSANTAATRPTYAGEGLLVTRCWISCLLTNGGRLGWLNRPSSVAARAVAPLAPAGMLMPRKLVAPVSCCAALIAIGSRIRSGVVLSVLAKM